MRSNKIKGATEREKEEGGQKGKQRAGSTQQAMKPDAVFELVKGKAKEQCLENRKESWKAI